MQNSKPTTSTISTITAKQIVWAMQHDWFISSRVLPVEITEVSLFSVTVRDDMKADSTLTFTNYSELRNWAGY